MLIDAHIHLFPDEVQADRAAWFDTEPYFRALYSHDRTRIATAGDALAMLQQHRINQAWVMGFGWSTRDACRLGNDAILTAAAASHGRLVPFVSLVLTDVDWSLAELDRCVTLGARGVGELMPDGQGRRLGDPPLAPIFDRCAQLGLVVTTHASEPVGHVYPGKGTVFPAEVLAAAERYPAVRWNFAHLGGGAPFYAHMPEVRTVLRRNAWFDLAAVPLLYEAGAIAAAATALGADRLLFASDFPLQSPARVRNLLEAASLATPDVLGDNAARLLPP